jgi:aminoglycoside 6'-N-acetyltransferase I
MPTVTIRKATETDRQTLLRFILELNTLEAAFEQDRRIDDGFAATTLDWSLAKVRDAAGVALIAVDSAEGAIGWAAAHSEPYPPYVRSETAAFGYVAELYVVPAWRGRGVGRALIGAVGAHFRDQGLRHLMIGSLAGNGNARTAYEAMGFRPYAVEYVTELG